MFIWTDLYLLALGLIVAQASVAAAWFCARTIAIWRWSSSSVCSTTRDMASDPSPQDAIPRVIATMSSRWWFFKLIYDGGVLWALVPFPLSFLLGRLLKKKRPDSGLWATAAYLIVGLLLCFAPPGDEGVRRIVETGRVMMTGAFLIGTLLSVSSGLVASSIIRTTVTRSPAQIVGLGAVFSWALLWGLSGGALLSIFGALHQSFRPLALVIGGIGIGAEVNAIVFVFRVFLLGLIELQMSSQTCANCEDCSKCDSCGHVLKKHSA